MTVRIVAIRLHGSRDGAIVRITRYALDVVAPRRMSRTELRGRLDAAGIVFNENHRPARWAPWRPVTGVALDGRLEAAPLLDLALKAHRALDSRSVTGQWTWERGLIWGAFEFD